MEKANSNPVYNIINPEGCILSSEIFESAELAIEFAKHWHKTYPNSEVYNSPQYGKIPMKNILEYFSLIEISRIKKPSKANRKKYETLKAKMKILDTSGAMVVFKKLIILIGDHKIDIKIKWFRTFRLINSYNDSYALYGCFYNTEIYKSIEDLINSVDWDEMEKINQSEFIKNVP